MVKCSGGFLHDFQLRMCGSSLRLDQGRRSRAKGVGVLQGNGCEAGTLKGKNYRYYKEVQAALGLLSRLHVLARIRLRGDVWKPELDGKEKRPAMPQ